MKLYVTRVVTELEVECRLSAVSISAITNYHKFGGLKQCKLILQKSDSGLAGLKINVSAGLYFKESQSTLKERTGFLDFSSF